MKVLFIIIGVVVTGLYLLFMFKRDNKLIDEKFNKNNQMRK